MNGCKNNIPERDRQKGQSVNGSEIERSFQDTLLFPLQDSSGYKNSCPAQAQDAEGLLSICVEVPRGDFPRQREQVYKSGD